MRLAFRQGEFEGIQRHGNERVVAKQADQLDHAALADRRRCRLVHRLRHLVGLV